jgi:hypothetical protein
MEGRFDKKIAKIFHDSGKDGIDQSAILEKHAS